VGEHAGHEVAHLQVITAAAPGVSSFVFDPMFPFTSPYTVWSGTCAGNEPSKYGQTTPTVQLASGGAPMTVNVLEPAIDVTARVGIVAVSGANVYVYPTTPGCSTARISLGPTGSDGKVANPGLPFGTYDVCADYRPASGSRTRVVWTNRTNSNVNGTALTATFPSGSVGACGTTTPTS